MSFILDALKKSESDRQRQSGPSLFEVKVAPPRRTLPVWAVAIAVLLGINVVVVSWMLLRRAPAQEPAAAPSTPAAAPAARALGAPAPGATAAAPAAAPAASGASAAGHAAAGVSAPAASPPAAPAAFGQSSVPAASTAPPPAAAPPPASGAPQGAAQAPADAAAGDSAPAVQPSAGRGAAASAATGVALPLYRQVVASDGLPALHLDLHVYARNPKNRFVMINMHKLVEGNSLPDGVHVDAIRPDGVVLSYKGTQFLLPRD